MHAIHTFLFLIMCYCSVVVVSVRTFWYHNYACRLNINGYIWKNIYRQKSTPKFDMSTHANAIFKTTYNELRPTTILFQLPRHPPWRKNRLWLVLRWGGVTPISRALLRFCRCTNRLHMPGRRVYSTTSTIGHVEKGAQQFQRPWDHAQMRLLWSRVRLSHPHWSLLPYTSDAATA